MDLFQVKVNYLKDIYLTITHDKYTITANTIYLVNKLGNDIIIDDYKNLLYVLNINTRNSDNNRNNKILYASISEQGDISLHDFKYIVYKIKIMM
jgi:hypothetical protein